MKIFYGWPTQAKEKTGNDDNFPLINPYYNYKHNNKYNEITAYHGNIPGKKFLLNTYY